MERVSSSLRTTDMVNKVDKVKKAVLESIGNGSTVSAAMKAVGMSRTMFYRWMKEDKSFNKAVRKNEDSAIQVIEDALWLRASNGHVTAMIFYLCNRMPERWKNVQRIEVEQLPKALENMTDEELQSYTNELLASTGVSLSSNRAEETPVSQ